MELPGEFYIRRNTANRTMAVVERIDGAGNVNVPIADLPEPIQSKLLEHSYSTMNRKRIKLGKFYFFDMQEVDV